MRLPIDAGIDHSYTAAELTTIVLAAVLVILLAIIGFRAWRRSRVTADERERRRCAHLVAIGKINDARLVEIRENLVFYSYAVRGVEYTASQDLSRFADVAVFDFSGVSAMSVKYDPEIRRTRSWRRRSGADCAGPRVSSRRTTPATDPTGKATASAGAAGRSDCA